MKISTNQIAFSNSSEISTFGIVVDLHDEGGRILAQETVLQTGDSELRNLVSMAQALGKKYLVAAGRFDGIGIFGAVCDDDENLIVIFQAANARLKETGSYTTAWMIKPDACAALLEKASQQNDQKGGK